MLRRIVARSVVVFSVLFMLNFILAQEKVDLGHVEKVYDGLYNKERFEAADANNDGVLDKEELSAEQKDFEHYRDAERFRHTDTNNDGALSLEECNIQKQWEEAHHKKLLNDALEDIK